jgi:tellurite resistance protein TehA-like permease
MAGASAATSPGAGQPCGITRLPNTCFGVCMGLGGHCVMWKTLNRAGFAWAPVSLVWALWLAGAATLCTFSLAFLVKIRLHPHRVKQEWNDAGRSQFFNAPNLAVMLLAIACPPSLETLGMLRATWVATACWQLTLTLFFYYRWMYGGARSMDSASTPYLLSVVGWFLLAVLGRMADIDELTGIGLTPMAFGVGTFFALITYITLFQTFNRGHTAAGAPALFLVIAPLSIASIALAAMGGGGGGISSANGGGGSNSPGSGIDSDAHNGFGGASQALLGPHCNSRRTLSHAHPAITTLLLAQRCYCQHERRSAAFPRKN